MNNPLFTAFTPRNRKEVFPLLSPTLVIYLAILGNIVMILKSPYDLIDLVEAETLHCFYNYVVKLNHHTFASGRFWDLLILLLYFPFDTLPRLQ